MALPDLTGQNIQDTYQRLVQVDDTGSLVTGTGSALPISFDGNNVTVKGTLTANSYIVSESIISISSGSTIFGNSLDDSHQFTGNITASGNISASGTVIANEFGLGETGDQTLRIFESSNNAHIKSQINNASIKIGGVSGNANTNAAIFNFEDKSVTVGNGFSITASKDPVSGLGGNISASGDTFANGVNGQFFGIKSTTFVERNINDLVLAGSSTFTSIQIGKETSTNPIILEGTVTASGDISSSIEGTVTAGSGSFHVLKGDTTSATGLEVNGYILATSITSSGGINSSGTVSGSVGQFSSATIQGHLTGKNNGQGQSNISGFDSLTIFGNATLGNNGNETHTLKGTTNFEGQAGELVLSELPVSASSFIAQTNITASGNISSSGDIISSEFVLNNQTIEGVSLTNPPGTLNIKAGNGGTLDVVGFKSLKTTFVDTLHTHITASGNISASGDIFAGHVRAATNFGLKDSGGTFRHFARAANSTNELEIGNTNFTDGIVLTGNVTASGNISASGNLYAAQSRATQFRGIDADFQIGANNGSSIITLTSHLTASGDISSSGTVIANKFKSSHYADDGTTNNYMQFDGTNHKTNFVNGGTTSATFDNTFIELNRPITASGDISASGIITQANSLHAGGGRAYFGEFGGSNPYLVKEGNNLLLNNGGLTTSEITASGNISSSGHIITPELRGSSIGGDQSGSLVLSGSLTLRPNILQPADSGSTLFVYKDPDNTNNLEDLRYNDIGLSPAFAFFSMDGNGTDDSNENPFGKGSGTVSATTHNMTSSFVDGSEGVRAYIQLDGIYKIHGTLICEASTVITNAEISLRKDGTDVFATTIAVHSSVDPVERSFLGVTSVLSGSYIDVTLGTPSSAGNLNMKAGSTFMVERLA